MNFGKVALVIPTYNERQSLPVLLEKVFSLGVEGLTAWVVNDNSPDGTGVLADELVRKYPMKVIHRNAKEGLGKAYTEAFKKVLHDNDNYDYIVHMDSDLSHDPKEIPVFLNLIESEDLDLIIGSRYINGGGVKNWGRVRRFISYFGNMYARLALGMPYRDLTGGFRCYRASALRKIELGNIDSLGYNFLIEMFYVAHKKGLKIKESPIIFLERLGGESKFNFGIFIEAFWRVLFLPWKGRQMIK